MTTPLSDKTIKTIQRVCNRLAEKYTFGFYDREDIEQEAFLIAMKDLPKYDKNISSLETFLFMHINNKLKTFKRDHYLRTDFISGYCGRADPLCPYCQRRIWRHSAKQHLMEPVDIDNVKGENEKGMRTNTDFIADIELNELLSLINKNLDISLREDYLKMIEGLSIPKNKKQVIEASIIEILENSGYYKER